MLLWSHGLQHVADQIREKWLVTLPDVTQPQMVTFKGRASAAAAQPPPSTTVALSNDSGLELLDEPSLRARLRDTTTELQKYTTQAELNLAKEAAKYTRLLHLLEACYRKVSIQHTGLCVFGSMWPMPMCCVSVCRSFVHRTWTAVVHHYDLIPLLRSLQKWPRRH